MIAKRISSAHVGIVGDARWLQSPTQEGRSPARSVTAIPFGSVRSSLFIHSTGIETAASPTKSGALLLHNRYTAVMTWENAHD